MKNSTSIEVIVAIFGFLGALIGSFFSIAGQYYLDYQKEKRFIQNLLKDNIVEFNKNITKISNAIVMYMAFLKENIHNLEEYQIDEVYDYLYNHSEQCYSIWPDFKTFLYKYLPNIVNNNGFEKIESIMDFFKMECLSLKLRKFVKYDKQMMIARKEGLMNMEEMFQNAKEYLSFIEDEYYAAIKVKKQKNAFEKK